MERYTFVVRVHPGGTSTVENLATHERALVAEIAAIGPQIERWLLDLPLPGDEPKSPPAEAR